MIPYITYQNITLLTRKRLQMTKLTEYLKNIFFILLFIQFAPPLIKNVKKQFLDNLEPKNYVGLIPINQPIFSSSPYSKQLNRFFKDPEIKAILLKIDSSGGAAGSCQALAEEVLQLKKQYPKPIVTYSENICASGAYYIAAMTDHIVTTGSAIVGSIGSKLSTQFKLKELLLDYKVKTENISTGAFKDVLDPFTDITEEQRAMLQQLSDDTYTQFTTDVAKQRHLQLQQKTTWAEGKVFTGQEALKLKLIDTIGNQTTATDYIKQNILHSDREIEFIKAPQLSALQQWFKQYDEDDEMQFSFIDSCTHSIVRAIKKQFS